VKPPCQAFPNLVSVSFNYLSYKSLQDLSRCCTALQQLTLTNGADVMWAFGEGFSEVESASVYRSIAQMQHLTHLELLFRDGTELLAFTLAGANVRTPQLRCLHVHGHLTPLCLVQLQRLHGLEELTVHVSHIERIMDTFHTEPFMQLLVAFAAVHKVCLVLPLQKQRDMVAAARQQAARLGLPVPAVVVVKQGKRTRS
jgi:hypothetical protein